MDFINLTGHKYGKLTVIKETGRTPNGAVRWLCQCDCGNTTKVASNNLRRPDPRYATKSCGCLSKYSKGEAGFRVLYRDYKNAAKVRKHKFELSESVFRNLVVGSCFYCGSEPNQTVSRKGMNGSFVYNGVDRVDNNKGYTLDNCVPCCGVCNNMKKVLSQEKFLEQVSRIYKHSVKGR